MGAGILLLRQIDKWYRRLLWLMMATAAVYIGLIMVAIVYSTTFRFFGWSYSPYTFTFIEYGFLYTLMLGSPWLVRHRGHVYIEILTAAVPDRVRNVLSRFVALLCAFVCLVFTWYLGALALDDYTTSKYDELRAQLDIQRWVVTAVLPLGFGLMTVEFLRFVFARETMHTGVAGVHE